jgi:hypothetical protein
MQEVFDDDDERKEYHAGNREAGSVSEEADITE